MFIICALAGIAVVIGQVGEDLEEEGSKGSENKYAPLEPLFGIPENPAILRKFGELVPVRFAFFEKCVLALLGFIGHVV